MSIFAFIMLSNLRKKEIISLKQKKYRQRYSQFLVEGEKSVLELCQSSFLIEEILVTEPVFEKLKDLLPTSKVLILNEKEHKQYSALDTSPGIIAVSNFEENTLESFTFYNQISLMLDSISDPGNLGTIIRIADWYGIKSIVCSPDCVDVYNPKTIAASMGSFTRVRLIYTPLDEILKSIPIPSFACVMNGELIETIKKPSEGFIVIGNEANGIHENNLKLCTHNITIPKKGQAESLNAAIATAIVCHSFIMG